MRPFRPLHRPPRHPHAWAWLFAASQLVVLAAWWRFGWMSGLPLLAATHLSLLWGTFAPGSALFSPVLTCLPTRERVVWLTIDDGPSDDTPAMLDLLEAAGARATFFLVGTRAARRPDLVRAIVARGHGVGNHSASHAHAWFWASSPARIRREVGQAQASLAALAGAPPRWFRAVVGHANPFVAAALHEHGLARVAWSSRGYDGVDGDVGRVLARIERDLRPGAIVLLHEGAPHGRNVAILAALLERLRALGYGTVLPDGSATTHQLLNGVLPDSGANVADSPAPDSRARSASASG